MYQTRMLSPLLLTRPAEFYDRLVGMIENSAERLHKPPVYPAMLLNEALIQLQRETGTAIAVYLDEPQLKEIEQEITERLARLPKKAPFPRKHNADLAFARSCYALTRAFAPQVIVETGVAYGVTSALILKALSVNKGGQLYSVDLAPVIDKDAQTYVGFAIPDALRDRWKLYRGSSRRVLPGLLSDLKEIDLFIHDSLHTLGNMTWEFRMARRYLKPRSLLVSDDIGGNGAFRRLVDEAEPDAWAAIREPDKQGLFGVAAFSDHS